MAIDPIAAVGSGIQGVQSIGAGAKGSQAGRQLDQRQQANDELLNQIIGGGMGQLGNMQNALAGFTNPGLSNQILGMGQQGAAQLGNLYGGGAEYFGAPMPPPQQVGPTPSPGGGSGGADGGDKGAATGGGGPTMHAGGSAGFDPTGGQGGAFLASQGGAGGLANQQMYAGGSPGMGLAGPGGSPGFDFRTGQQRGVNPGTGLTDQAGNILGQSGIGNLVDNLGALGGLNQFQADFANQLPDINFGGQGPQVQDRQQFQAPGMQQFDFEPGNQIQQQAMQGALDFGAGQRATAQEQAALGFQGAGDAVNRMLADRGMGGASGVGAAAMRDIALGQGQQMAELNRGLSADASQLGLQAGQFDAQNALARNQLGSQYNLGFQGMGQDAAARQFGLNLGAGQQNFEQQLAAGQFGQQGQALAAQYALGRGGLAGQQAGINAGFQGGMNQLLAGLAGQGGQMDLARAGQLAGLQGQLDQRALTGIGLGAQGITGPMDMLQGLYQQNYLSPQMAMMGMLNPQALMQGALGFQQSNLDRRQHQVDSAGRGKGAATGGAISTATNKRAGTGAGGGGSSGGR